MPYCAVITCKRRTETNNLQTDGTSFHRFPSEPEVKEKWIAAVGRGTVWWPSKTSTICSVHFKEKQYQVLPKKRKLFDWAVPTLKLPVDPKPSSLNDDTTAKHNGSNNMMKIDTKEVDSENVVLDVIKEVIYIDKTSSTPEQKNAELMINRFSKNEATELSSSEDDESRMDPLNPKKQEIAMQDEAQSMHKMRIQIQRYKAAVVQKNKKIRTLRRKTQRYRDTIIKLRDELKKSLEKNVPGQKNTSENSS